MKKILSNLYLVAIIILVGYIVFLQECSDTKIPKGKILVSGNFIDSLTAIANMPPDTIKIDTLITTVVTEYIDRPIPIPTPDPIDPEINYYADSTSNDTVSFWVEAWVKGSLVDWNWRHAIEIEHITTTIEVSKPIPVPYEVTVSKNGLYGSLRVGGGTHAPGVLFGAESHLITKTDNIYGLAYSRFGDENLIAFSFGTKLFKH